LRFGTEGGPFFPWMNQRFMQTAQGVSEANALQKAPGLLIPNQGYGPLDPLPPLPPGYYG